MGSGGGSSPIRRWVEDKVEKVKSFFFGSSKKTSKSVSNEDRYDPEKAKMEETLRINKILTEFRTDVEKQSDKLEKDILKQSRESLDHFTEELKRINDKDFGGKKLNINLDRLMRENRKTEDEIYGFIKKHVQRKVSLDNYECQEILKMKSGATKEKAMEDFSNKILREALTKLSKKIENSIKEQGENLSIQIEERIDFVQKNMEETLNKFKEIENLKLQDEIGLEEEKSKTAYKLVLCDRILSEIEVSI